MIYYEVKPNSLGLSHLSSCVAKSTDENVLDNIASVDFYLNNTSVIIKHVGLTPRFFNKYKRQHITTEVFRYMIYYLIEHKINFTALIGSLSSADAESKWICSIPFYLSLSSLVIDEYCFSVHIYDMESANLLFNADIPYTDKDILLCIEKYKHTNSWLRFVITKHYL